MIFPTHLFSAWIHHTTEIIYTKRTSDILDLQRPLSERETEIYHLPRALHALRYFLSFGRQPSSLQGDLHGIEHKGRR